MYFKTFYLFFFYILLILFCLFSYEIEAKPIRLPPGMTEEQVQCFFDVVSSVMQLLSVNAKIQMPQSCNGLKNWFS